MLEHVKKAYRCAANVEPSGRRGLFRRIYQQQGCIRQGSSPTWLAGAGWRFLPVTVWLSRDMLEWNWNLRMCEHQVSEQKVFRFIADQIDTIPQMEALLLLWNSRPRPWTEEQLVARLYVDAQTVKSLLQDLAARRLVHVAGEGAEKAYRYETESAEMDRLMEAVADTYRVELLRVSALIHSKASPGVRAFARAFKFTKERD